MILEHFVQFLAVIILRIKATHLRFQVARLTFVTNGGIKVRDPTKREQGL